LSVLCIVIFIIYKCP